MASTLQIAEAKVVQKRAAHSAVIIFLIIVVVFRRDRSLFICTSGMRRGYSTNCHAHSSISFRGLERNCHAAVDNTDLNKLTVVQLKDMLREQCLPLSGNKPDLVMRLSQNAQSCEEIPCMSLEVEISSSDKFRIMPTDPEAALPIKLVEALSRIACVKHKCQKSKPLSEVQFSLKELEKFRRSPELDCFKTARLPPEWVVAEILCTQEKEATLSDDAADTLERYFESGDTERMMRRHMRDSQQEAVRHALVREGRVLLADEMGLGKSLSSLVIAQQFAEEWPMLIVAPKSVVLNWQAEIEKWFPHFSSETQILMSAMDEPKDRSLILITSYDQIVRKPQFQRQSNGKPYQVVIIDEAHYMKSPDTVRTATLLPICQKAKRCILLSGTPVLNCAAEVWSLAAALTPRCGSFDEFCDRYGVVDNSTGDPRQVGVRHPKELQIFLGSLMLRRRKADVLPNLGLKQRFQKLFSGNQLDSKYTRMFFAKTKALQKGYASAVFALTAKAKKDSVAAYVQSLLGREEKIVVFAHHHVVLDAVQKRMADLGIEHVRIDGKTPQTRRHDLVNEFRDNPDVRVAIMAITAAGQGISLTAARIVVFAELHWVPGKLLQAEDRVHRAGQEHSVEIHYCVAEGRQFMDQSILRTLEEKLGVVESIVGDDAMPTSFTQMELVQNSG